VRNLLLTFQEHSKFYNFYQKIDFVESQNFWFQLYICQNIPPFPLNRQQSADLIITTFAVYTVQSGTK